MYLEKSWKEVSLYKTSDTTLAEADINKRTNTRVHRAVATLTPSKGKFLLWVTGENLLIENQGMSQGYSR